MQARLDGAHQAARDEPVSVLKYLEHEGCEQPSRPSKGSERTNNKNKTPRSTTPTPPPSLNTPVVFITPPQHHRHHPHQHHPEYAWYAKLGTKTLLLSVYIQAKAGTHSCHFPLGMSRYYLYIYTGGSGALTFASPPSACLARRPLWPSRS